MENDRIIPALLYFAHSSLILALAVASLVFAYATIIGLQIGPAPLLVAFLWTFSMYNLNKLSDKSEDDINYPERSAFVNACRTLFKSSVVLAYATALLIAFFIAIWLLLLLVAITIVVTFYSFSLPSLHHKVTATKNIRFKKIHILKNLIVAFSWGLVPASIVHAYHSLPLNFMFFGFFVFVFLRLYFGGIIADIRDIKGDKAVGIITIPAKYGIEKSLRLITAGNFSILFFIFFAQMFSPLPPLWPLLSISCVYAQIYIAFAKRVSINVLNDLIVETEFIFLAFVYLILTL